MTVASIDLFGLGDVDIDAFDFLGDAMHADVRAAVDDLSMKAAMEAAASADPLPDIDRANVVDMTFRRRGAQRALNLIAATMLRPHFKDFDGGSNG